MKKTLVKSNRKVFSGILSFIFTLSLFTLFLPLKATAATYPYDYNDNGFVYRVYSDHAVALGYSINDPKSTLWNQLLFNGIKTNVDGVPVTVIGGNALFGKGIKELIIPQTVIQINNGGLNGAFAGTDLTSVVIPENVEILGGGAFKGCNNLKEIYFLNPYCEIQAPIWKAGSIELQKLDLTQTISNNVKNGIGTFTGKIYGFSGSTAEEYAAKCGYQFADIMTGDVIVTSNNGNAITTITTTTNTTTTKTTTKYPINTVTQRVNPTTTTTTISKQPTVINKSYLHDNGKPYELSPKDGSDAITKPKLEVTKKVFTSAEEAAGQVVRIEFIISGAEQKYCTTAINVYWDERLTVIPSEYGIVKGGEAFDDLGIYLLNHYKNHLRISTIGSGDYGYDGVMFTIDLKVPDDAKNGDVYPIDVAYYTAGEGKAGDLFTNNKDDEQGKLMQAYFFTKGINSSQNPSTDPYLIAAGVAFADGYIAIDENYDPNKPVDIVTPVAGSTTKTTTTTRTTTKATTPTTTTTTSIKPTQSELKIDVSDITLENGGQYTIKANQTGLTYRSNDTNVAVVSKNGVITALGEGEAVISVFNSDFDVVQLKCKVMKKENYVYGDANIDGTVDISDAVLIMQNLSNPSKYGENGTDKAHITAKGIKYGDVSGNGDGLTNKDALAIQRYMLKLISSLPE